MSYIGATHSNDPLFNIVCGVNCCIQKYSNYASFRKHLKLKHLESQIESAATNEDDFMEETLSICNDIHNQSVCDFELESDSNGVSELNEHQAALFALKFREIHKVSQLALTEIMTETSTMINISAEDIRKKVFSIMKINGVSLPTACVQSLEDLFKAAKKDPFESLYTEYCRTKYYHENMGLVVSIINYT